MSGELFYSLAGTEAELKRLSAEDYLRAKAEAYEMKAEYPDDEETYTLLLAACLMVRGAYDGDKPLFSSAYEVLSALSPDELLSAAEEYFLKDLKKTESFEDIYDASGRIASHAGDMSEYMKNGEKNTAEVMTTEKIAAEKMPTEKMPDILSPKHREDNMPYAQWRRTPMSRSVNIQYGDSTDVIPAVPDTTDFVTADMHAVSDFFERDARRFPGGFDIF